MPIEKFISLIKNALAAVLNFPQNETAKPRAESFGEGSRCWLPDAVICDLVEPRFGRAAGSRNYVFLQIDEKFSGGRGCLGGCARDVEHVTLRSCDFYIARAI